MIDDKILNNYLNSKLVSDLDKKKIESMDEKEIEKNFKTMNFSPEYERDLDIGSDNLNEFTVFKIAIKIVKFLKNKFLDDEKKYSIILSIQDEKFAYLFNIMKRVFLNEGFDIYLFNKSYPDFVLSYSIRRIDNAILGVSFSSKKKDDNRLTIKLFDENGSEYVLEKMKELVYSLQLVEDLNDYKFIENKGKIFYLDDEKFISNFILKEISTSYFLNIFRGERKTKLFLIGENVNFLTFYKEALKNTFYTINIIERNYKKTDSEILSSISRKENDYPLCVVFDNTGDIESIYYLNNYNKLKRIENYKLKVLIINLLVSTLKKRNLLPTNAVIYSDFILDVTQTNAILDNEINLKVSGYKFSYITNMIQENRKKGLNSILAIDENYSFLVADYVREKDIIQSLIFILDTVEYLLRQGKNLDIAIKEINKKYGDYIYKKEFFKVDKANKFLNNFRNREIKKFNVLKVLKKIDYFKKEETDYLLDVSLPTENVDSYSLNGIKYYLDDDGYICFLVTDEDEIMVVLNLKNRDDISFIYDFILNEIKSMLKE